MTCYIAARFTDKPRARMVRATLVNAGFQVQSRWLYARTLPLTRAAVEDLEDIRRCDVLVFVQAPWDARGMRGAFVEVGYALARKLPVLVWDDTDPDESSPNWTVFWSHPLVSVYATLPALVDALAARAFRLAEGPIG